MTIAHPINCTCWITVGADSLGALCKACQAELESLRLKARGA